MLGKVKTVVQMIAIPFLLYHGVLFGLDRHAALGHGADHRVGDPDHLVDGLLPAEGVAGNSGPVSVDGRARIRPGDAVALRRDLVDGLRRRARRDAARAAVRLPRHPLRACRSSASRPGSTAGRRGVAGRATTVGLHLVVTGVLMQASLPRRRVGGCEGRARRRNGRAHRRIAAGADGALGRARTSRSSGQAGVDGPPVARPRVRLRRHRPRRVAKARRRGDRRSNLAFSAIALVGITVGTLYQKRFVGRCDVRSATAVQMLVRARRSALPLALARGGAFRVAPSTSSPRWPGRCVVLTLGGSSLSVSC